MIRSKRSRTASPGRRSPRSLKRVLVALDGSPEGETVLKHLEGLFPPRAKLFLLHVLPAPVPSSTPEVANLLRLQEDAEEYLEDVRERYPQLRSQGIVETGDPVERILATAREEDVDVLALTTHARSGLTSLLMGSVARKVVQRASRPVFLVRPDAPPPRKLGRILLPLDGPKGAEAVLRAVVPLARETEATATLLHVLPFPRVADPVTGFNPVVLKPMQLPELAWLDPLVDHLTRHGVPAEKSVLAGEPDEVILRESRDADLIALRTRGRGGLARLVLGSVAEKVVRHSNRPTLLFHRVDE